MGQGEMPKSQSFPERGLFAYFQSHCFIVQLLICLHEDTEVHHFGTLRNLVTPGTTGTTKNKEACLDNPDVLRKELDWVDHETNPSGV